VMSFAQALGLGYFSEGEYMEVALDDSASLDEAVKALNATLPEGIRMTGGWRMPEDFPTLMASVTAARWLVEFEESVDETLIGKFSSLLVRENIEVEKEGKNGTSVVDIRPGIYSIAKTIPPIACGHPPFIRGGGDCGSIQPSENPQERNPPYEGGGRELAAGGLFTGIELLLAAGSKFNIRPELVVKAALGSADAAKAVTRRELYSTGNERHMPLYKLFDTGDF
jgi:hypothetical protein